MTTTETAEQAFAIYMRTVAENAGRRIAAGYGEAEALAGAMAEFTAEYPAIGQAFAEALTGGAK